MTRQQDGMPSGTQTYSRKTTETKNEKQKHKKANLEEMTFRTKTCVRPSKLLTVTDRRRERRDLANTVSIYCDMNFI